MEPLKLIDSFTGEYEFLSNFYKSPFSVLGEIYLTNEHFFQAHKTLKILERKEIIAASTPGQAKKLGRKVTLRSDWDEVKELFMYSGLVAKFGAHPELAAKLVATGQAHLQEGNYWNDTYWGVCNGVGKNRLGILLMRLRDNYVRSLTKRK